MSGLLRSNLVVAGGTALSRVTGLIRVVVFAKVAGQAALADAYNSANSSPNAIYELLVGGVLSASLVPMFTRHREERDDEATSAVITVAVLAVSALTVVSVVAAPAIFRLFALNVDAGVDPGLYRAAGTALTRIFLIQIFFYGVTALVSALLTAHRRFFAAAWAPVLSNVVIILSLLLVPATVAGRRPELGEILTNDSLRWTLALGATAGIGVMALALLPAVRGAGITLRWNPDFRHPAVRRLLNLSTWTLGYVAFNQLAVIVMQNLADPGSGQVDAYAKAYILFVLPHGLLAMSVATTFQPEMATKVAQRDRSGFIERTTLGIGLIALMTVPAGLLMFALRRPIVGLTLQHGKFGADAALVTSRALAGFAIGLVGFSVYLFVLRAFYAHGDARTPFVINAFENLINIVLGFALVGRYGVLGLSLSFAIAYLIAAVWALWVLSNKVPGFPAGDVVRRVAGLLVAGAVCAEVAWLVADRIGSNVGFGALARVLIGSLCGLAAYVATLVGMRAPEVDQLRARLRQRAAAGAN